jgi:hypothetical protein
MIGGSLDLRLRSLGGHVLDLRLRATGASALLQETPEFIPGSASCLAKRGIYSASSHPLARLPSAEVGQ